MSSIASIPTKVGTTNKPGAVQPGSRHHPECHQKQAVTNSELKGAKDVGILLLCIHRFKETLNARSSPTEKFPVNSVRFSQF